MQILTRFNKFQWATAIAVFFHAIGMFGLLLHEGDFFVNATSTNLLLVLGLLLWTQTSKNIPFFIYFMACFITGMGVEIVGVQTSALFGHYNYGEVLGYKIWGVPLLLGVNWFIVTYCSGMAIHQLVNKYAPQLKGISRLLLFVPVAAATAVFYDWLMEPVAIKLGYWQWGGDGSVPVYNYITWFIVSLLLLTVFHYAHFNKQNKFAVNLLIVHLLFFGILRNFL
jgi:putative membrane protein